MKLPASSLNAHDTHRLLIGAVLPRPIAFVSSVGDSGAFNLAPFSFFTVASANPPVLCFSVGRREGNSKDTLRNVRQAGDFVVNIVTEGMASGMNVTAAEFPYGVSEFAEAGFTPIASEMVKSPRVAESPINMECKLLAVLDLGRSSDGSSLVLGEVLCFHVRDEIYFDGRIDTSSLKPLGRLAGNSYCHVTETFEMVRPRYTSR